MRHFTLEPRDTVRFVVKYRYLDLYLYLSTILSVLYVLEYLIGENSKYLYLYLQVLDPKYLEKIKYFSNTVEPPICICLLTIQVN